jgi:putative copper export protein/mono/diheme cytochrome c family protein
MTLFNGSIPSFDFGDAGLWLVAARSLFVIALFVGYGSVLYRARLAPIALKAMPGKSGLAISKQYERLSGGGLAIALMAAIIWLVVQSQIMFSANGTKALLQAVGSTLASTDFGHVLLVQMASISLALVAIFVGRKNHTALDAAVGLAGFAVIFQVGHNHATSMTTGISFLMLIVAGHLLAGAAWLGSLPALLVTIRSAPPSAAHASAQRFSTFGSTCVITLVITALFQGWQLIGSIPGLIGTAYGWMALAKTCLLMILLGFAAHNRHHLTPALKSGGAVAKKQLVRSIAFETGFGFLILIAACMLVTLPPSIHEQPVWPFSVQPSLVTILEEPDFFHEVVWSLLALFVAVAIVMAGIVFKRLRWPAVAIAAIIAWFAIPHLDLLFVEASPTSFYHSTTGFSSISIAQAKGLYGQNCASCHGAEGRGDGPAAAGLPEPPADLTAPHLWAHSDGELFGWLTYGIKSPEGEQAMPAFAGVLTEEERWNLIDFIRGRNSGLNYGPTGNWTPNIQAPSFQVKCGDNTLTSADLKGRVIRLVFGKMMPTTLATNDIADRLVTVLASASAVPTDDSHCLAQDPSLTQAYATVLGIAADKLLGTEFLIDTNGWLRAAQKPVEKINWNDPGKLEEQVVQLCAHPLATSDVDHAHHHH